MAEVWLQSMHQDRILPNTLKACSEIVWRHCVVLFAGHLIASRYIIMLHKVIKGKLVISDKVQAKTNTF
jgi:hypothetical protein